MPADYRKVSFAAYCGRMETLTLLASARDVSDAAPQLASRYVLVWGSLCHSLTWYTIILLNIAVRDAADGLSCTAKTPPIPILIY